MVNVPYPEGEDRLITVEEAALILTLKSGTVRALVYKGKLPTVRPADTRCVRFRLSDVQRLAGLRPTAAPANVEPENEGQP